MAQVTAKLNSLRIAPRKVRAVANLLRGKDVSTALAQLEHYIKKSSKPLKKLLDSAIANAENNFNMVKDNLYVKELMVNEGVKLKRFRAKGFGRAAPLQKKTSHITITLDERTPGLRREKTTVKSKKEATEEKIKSESHVHEGKKPEIKREIGSKGNMLGNLGKKLFQRKAI